MAVRERQLKLEFLLQGTTMLLPQLYPNLNLTSMTTVFSVTPPLKYTRINSEFRSTIKRVLVITVDLPHTANCETNIPKTK